MLEMIEFPNEIMCLSVGTRHGVFLVNFVNHEYSGSPSKDSLLYNKMFPLSGINALLNKYISFQAEDIKLITDYHSLNVIQKFLLNLSNNYGNFVRLKNHFRIKNMKIR